jgi:hypothetical protein
MRVRKSKNIWNRGLIKFFFKKKGGRVLNKEENRPGRGGAESREATVLHWK